ncbi:hypothetical protein [Streptomyces paludis]|uniref:hypothetical protein n=1 Tax=Streptomyces paludis TaxID=2282738 RepID=UPI001E3F02C3|nr:hypothetical protein [Streptomyces paludis]
MPANHRATRAWTTTTAAAAAGALAATALLALPSPAHAAAPTWYCGDSSWSYPDPATEVRTLLCLGDTLGQLTPSLTSECKYNGTWGWNSTQCDAKDLRFRLTNPSGTVYNGTMPDGTGYYWDIYGTPEVPCAVGDWTYEQSSTHRKWGDSWSPAGPWGDTSSTRTINVSACG